jgi:hypothetical protein
MLGAVKKLVGGSHIFLIRGAAGSGKKHTLNQIMDTADKLCGCRMVSFFPDDLVTKEQNNEFLSSLITASFGLSGRKVKQIFVIYQAENVLSFSHPIIRWIQKRKEYFHSIIFITDDKFHPVFTIFPADNIIYVTFPTSRYIKNNIITKINPAIDAKLRTFVLDTATNFHDLVRGTDLIKYATRTNFETLNITNIQDSADYMDQISILDTLPQLRQEIPVSVHKTQRSHHTITAALHHHYNKQHNRILSRKELIDIVDYMRNASKRRRVMFTPYSVQNSSLDERSIHKLNDKTHALVYTLC